MNDGKIIDLLARLNMIIYKMLSKRFKELECDVTPVQAKIMVAIKQAGNVMAQKDVEGITACNKSTISSVLSTMEKNNLIVRIEDDIDNRKKIIKLTDYAIHCISKLELGFDDVNDNVVNILESNEYDLFSCYVNKIYGVLKEELE